MSIKELHRFARGLKFKRGWFQAHRRHPHYDLTTERALGRALEAGAVRVSSRELVRRMARWPCKMLDAVGQSDEELLAWLRRQ
jgi:hypothetical protein